MTGRKKRKSPDGFIRRTVISAVAAMLLVTMPPNVCLAGPIKIATWNLDWLTSDPEGQKSIPPDVYRRQPADFARLSAYAQKLDADVIGFQEVDQPRTAAMVFPLSRYAIVMSDDRIEQRVGIAVKRMLHVTRNRDLTALNVYPPTAPHALRSGLDVTIADGSSTLRVLVVHLKTGCWDNPWNERGHSCPTLENQFEILNDWILERTDEGQPFAIIGDFNRRLAPHDPFYMALTHDAPLTLTTSGRASPCWGGEYFIDHLLLGGGAEHWMAPGSLRVATFKNTDIPPDHLSDHCPVSIKLSPP
nr:endonuclease/exonuclease/phosphatase family protein [Acetobacter nitrogenifigens]